MDINVKYFNGDMDRIKALAKGDWLDLRCVGVTRLHIANTISKVVGVNVLQRQCIKETLKVEDGWYNENGVTEEVKFFRYSKGDVLLLDLGIAMKLPAGKEAHVLPRGGTFKNFTLIETNSMGIIDNSFCGDGDRWFMPVLAMQDGFVMYNERVCQMKIVDKMDLNDINFNEVEILGNPNRGSLSSSGTK